MKIAIIAHDGKKAEMVQFLNTHKELLLKQKVDLVSTGTTGLKAKKAGFEVNALKSGSLGGRRPNSCLGS